MSNISEIIEKWYIHNKRDLPWRNTRSPYFIWVSEIILQQTRVNQGINYYVRFIERYPDIESLSSADLDDILKLWQGLGYYARARNMLAAAKTIAEKYNGKFPSSYHELLKLKGVGSYTAAAIASISFNEPVAVVDGNVFRVLARLYGEKSVISSSKGFALFKRMAESILDRTNPGLHNQALMELGSLICLPKKPLCQNCPLSKHCKAFQAGLVHEFPAKQGKIKSRKRYFNYLFITYNETTYIYQRQEKDIWNSLYEFPLIETVQQLSDKELFKLKSWEDIINGKSFIIEGISKIYRHQLTHQTIHAVFYKIFIEEDLHHKPGKWIKVSRAKLEQYAVPRLIDRYLQDLKRGTDH